MTPHRLLEKECLVRKLLIPAVAAALLFTGCAAPVTPKQALSDAATKTAQGKDLSYSMKIDTTADDLKKVMTATSSSAVDAQTQSIIDVATSIIPKTVMKVSMHSNGADLNTEKDPQKLDMAMSLAVDSKPIEIMWVKGEAFLHADVEGIGQATGLFTAAQVKMLASSAAASMPWINDVVGGKWVALDKTAVNALIEKAKLQMASAAPSAAPSIDAAKATAAFMDASEITKVDDKTYKSVTDAKKLIKAMAAMDPNDQLTDAQADESIAKINDGANLDVTYTLTDGKVSKAVIDVADIMRTWPKADPAQPELAKLAATDFKMALVVEMANDVKITAPSAASTIPASDLEGLTQG